MATKKSPIRSKKSATFKTRFNANRNKFILIGVAVALLVGGLGYNLLNQSEAATGCRQSTLRVGSSGNCVKTLQRIVGTGVDGKFGSQTKSRVQFYQRRVNVTSDGIVGRNTWSAICRDLNGTNKHLAYLAGTIGCDRAKGVGNTYYYK